MTDTKKSPFRMVWKVRRLDTGEFHKQTPDHWRDSVGDEQWANEAVRASRDQGLDCEAVPFELIPGGLVEVKTDLDPKTLRWCAHYLECTSWGNFGTAREFLDKATELDEKAKPSKAAIPALPIDSEPLRRWAVCPEGADPTLPGDMFRDEVRAIEQAVEWAESEGRQYLIVELEIKVVG